MPDQILVLVVEDEELVRVIITEVLRDEDFEVMEAEHAEAAASLGHKQTKLLLAAQVSEANQHLISSSSFIISFL